MVGGLYGLWRFFIEYLRDDPERGFAFGFSTSQLISLALVPVCIIAYVQLRKRAEEQGDPPLPPWALEPAAAAAAAPNGRGQPSREVPTEEKEKEALSDSGRGRLLRPAECFEDARRGSHGVELQVRLKRERRSERRFRKVCPFEGHVGHPELLLNRDDLGRGQLLSAEEAVPERDRLRKARLLDLSDELRKLRLDDVPVLLWQPRLLQPERMRPTLPCVRPLRGEDRPTERAPPFRARCERPH